MFDFDVIIIGAGPAGSATAIHAGRAGLSVLLIDACPFPRDKICGDSLSAVVVAEVRELGLEDRLLALENVHAREISFHAGELSVTVPVLKIDSQARARSLVCRRILFDEMLFHAAKETDNVTALDWCRATEISVKPGHGCEVQTDRGGGRTHSFTARMLVGADGANSLVARRMRVPKYSEHRILTVQAYYNQVIGLREHMEIHFLEELLPGYLWVHPTRTSLANVGMAVPLASWLGRRVCPNQILSQTLSGLKFQERFRFAELVGRPKTRILPGGDVMRTIHGHGFMLVGDAAGLATPCSTEGVGNSLVSARLAGRTLVEAMQTGDFGADALDTYPGRLWREIGGRLQMSQRLSALRTSKAVASLIRSASRRPHNAGWISGVLIGSALPSNELEDLLGYLSFFNR
jgi:geranylgeranyl reductase family protein